MEHNLAHYKANSLSTHSLQTRSDAPSPLVPNGHWKMDSTPGGQPLISPTDGAFNTESKYDAPDHAVPRHDSHDHPAPKSAFTNLLLPYTSNWPLLHAIMVEKDSRRIFYFMS